MGEKETIEKLEGLGRKMVGQVKEKKSPTFETPLRSRGNIEYDNAVGFLRLGDKREERRFLNVAQARTFMQTVAVANKTKKFLIEDLHTSIRGLYYQLKFSLGENLDESLFEEQTESNALIEDLEVAMGIKREDLHLTTDRKGVVAGNMIVKDNFAGEEITINCAKQGRSGWMIPSDVDNGMEFVDVKADYVLVVEKDALWQRLNEDKFWKKDNCILITPKGQASRGTRRLIRRLADKGIPVYVFTDCDAWGWYIYWTIKTGSMNLAYLGRDFSIPEARFLGVTMADIEKFGFLKKLTIKAKPIDIKRAEEMMSYPWISAHPEWVKELKKVVKEKRKIEQDALQGKKLTFVGEYIRKKINNKEWLP
ncbi:DNA topoisomerase VI [Candidatus Micrarchaeota archaeon]|nr:DNA topoisomerase VI [Candidatus Micrarchaeota archaeon]MBD3418006.1 DNA topoisomerase VI [Candidatus Micrarchaeota archaeon]